jgi:hypothetical protein
MNHSTGRVAFTSSPHSRDDDSRAHDDRSRYARQADALGELFDSIVEADYIVNLAMARRCQAIERAREWNDRMIRETAGGDRSATRTDIAERAFTAEVAAALHLPERTAQNLIWTSRTLVTQLPNTLQALADSRLSYRHAQILVDHSYSLEGAAVAALEAAVLPSAERMTPSQFERKVRKTRERIEPESMVERKIKADAERFVAITPERDGMAMLTALLPAAQAVAIDARLTDICRGLQTTDENRTLTQLRADVFSDILLDADGETAPRAGAGLRPTERYRSIRPRVLVTVPAMTLLRKGRDGGSLEGYGPIDPQTARDLTAEAPTLQRLLTDPETGAVLSIGRSRYRVPEDLKTWLRVRDGTCRFPGCSRSAGRCDIDHTDDWQNNGGTDHWNLAHLCPGHHTLKHASEWKVRQDPGGSGELTWTSPSGNHYVTTADTEMLAGVSG